VYRDIVYKQREAGGTASLLIAMVLGAIHPFFQTNPRKTEFTPPPWTLTQILQQAAGNL